MGGAHRSSRTRARAKGNSNLSKSMTMSRDAGRTIDFASLSEVSSMSNLDKDEHLSSSDTVIIRNTSSLNRSQGNHYITRGDGAPGGRPKTSFTSSINSENLSGSMTSLGSIGEIFNNSDKSMGDDFKSNSLPNVRSKGAGSKGTGAPIRSGVPTSDRTAISKINAEKCFKRSGSNNSDTSRNLVSSDLLASKRSGMEVKGSESGAEKEAAAIGNLLSKMGNGGAGGGVNKFKEVASKVIAVQSLSVHKDEDEIHNSELVPPRLVVNLWEKVDRLVQSENISINNKIVCDALDTAKKYYATSKEGRAFIDKNLHTIIERLLSQSPENLSSISDKIGLSDADYLETSIRFALQLIETDLRMNAHKFTVECNTLSALSPIFDAKNVYYKGSTSDVRMEKIMVFQRIRGFYQLAVYLNSRCGTSTFPDWMLVHRALKASYQAIAFLRIDLKEKLFLQKLMKEANCIAGGVMKHLGRMESAKLANEEVKKLSTIVSDLLALSEQFAFYDSNAMPEYLSFCQDIIVGLLSAQSIQHKEFGQTLLHTVIQSIYATRPLMSTFTVTGAGAQFINGTYEISSSDQGGYVIPAVYPRYKRLVEPNNQSIVLFLDTSSDHDAPTWCLSEEHEDEPGEFEYTDIYTYVPNCVNRPTPFSGWVANDECYLPTPTLAAVPKMVPIREEHKTLKEDLASWFLEAKVPNLILGTNEICMGIDPSLVVRAIDKYLSEPKFVSDKMADLFASILPSICSVPSSPTPALLSSNNAAAAAAIEAAKRNLASAERWMENTVSMVDNAARMLRTAESEHQGAARVVEEARAYLASLEDSRCQLNGAEDVAEIIESAPLPKKPEELSPNSSNCEADIKSELSEVNGKIRSSMKMGLTKLGIGRSSFG